MQCGGKYVLMGSATRQRAPECHVELGNATSERVHSCTPMIERDKVVLRGKSERDENMHNNLGQDRGVTETKCVEKLVAGNLGD